MYFYNNTIAMNKSEH